MDAYLKKIELVEQEIQEIQNSKQFNDPEVIVYANDWKARQAQTPEELTNLAKYTALNARLDQLEKQRKDWHQAIQSVYASSAKKKDSTRKEYKKETAIKNEREILTTVADSLYKKYGFPIVYHHPTFGDVQAASGFYSPKDIIDYFRKKKQDGSVSLNEKLRNEYDEDTWIAFVELNSHVNPALHRKLHVKSGKIEVVLEKEIYESNSEIFTKVLSDLYNVKIDVKNAESDSQVMR